MSTSRPAARTSTKTGRAVAGSASKKAKGTLAAEVRGIVASLKRLGTRRNREGMARYAIPSDKAFGVSVSTIQQMAKRQGRNHELALALWDTGWYEARMMCAFLDEPERVTPAQMERWCRDFDNWAICDTLCFQLFDRTPHAFDKVRRWSGRRDEFEKRAAFALLASLATHNKAGSDDEFLRCLPLIEEAAADERNFVKKGVSWALRGSGRRNPRLHAAAVKLAQRLASSSPAGERWVGKDALRDLTRPLVVKQIERRKRAAGSP